MLVNFGHARFVSVKRRHARDRPTTLRELIDAHAARKIISPDEFLAGTGMGGVLTLVPRGLRLGYLIDGVVSPGRRFSTPRRAFVYRSASPSGYLACWPMIPRAIRLTTAANCYTGAFYRELNLWSNRSFRESINPAKWKLEINFGHRFFPVFSNSSFRKRTLALIIRLDDASQFRVNFFALALYEFVEGILYFD